MRHITTVQFDGTAKRALEHSRARVLVTLLLFLVVFGAIGLRIVNLGLAHAGDSRIAMPGSVPAEDQRRADIVDRNGVVLATDLMTVSLFAEPESILDVQQTAEQLAGIFKDLSSANLALRMRDGRNFVWIKRKLTPAQQQAVLSLGNPGLKFQEEIERLYPQESLAAHIVGFTDLDNTGIAGIEKQFDSQLKAGAADNRVLQLSLDARVQHAVRHELGEAVEFFSAAGGAGLVMDVNTGEMLAMVSLPDFDPNEPGDAARNRLYTNKATKGVYEMGSTLKTFTLAMALEDGGLDITDGFDATKPIHISRFTIHDDHPQARWLSLPEIYMYSSNIGSAKMARHIGGERQQAFLSRLGMLDRPSLELPEISDPIVPQRWREISTMTVGYGHGIAVSALQVAAGIAALTNGGIYHNPTLIRQKPGLSQPGKRVISAKTSRTMQALMRLVVENGTGKKAEAKGYLIGGKTGTAEKAGAGGYIEDELMTSFVASFPIDDPRYVVFVMLDEPKGRKETYGFRGAGWNAAPLAGQIIERVAPLLNVAPRQPETHPGVEELMKAIRSRREVQS